MRLSIIVPVYNEAPFLRRCLNSLPISEDVEAIVVDDGSTDGSAKICSEYTEQHRVILRLENHGVSEARNLAMSKAEGDYITFLDADDEWTPDALKQITAAIKEYPDAPVIQLNHYLEHANGTRTVRMYNAPGYYRLRNLPKLWVSSVNKIGFVDF